VLKLPIEEAKEEIKRLIEGEETRYVLANCISCMTCNYLCPEGCDPYHLILSKWSERYEREGLPLRVKLVLPLEIPNFLSIAKENMPEDERRTLEAWSKASNSREEVAKAKEVMYASCNAQIFPYLTYTKILEGLTIIGEQGLCCGEIYYRMGLLEVLSRIAHRVGKRLNSLGLKKLITFCPACYNMLKNVYLKFGVHLDFEIQDMREWLWEKIKEGEIEIKREVNKTATIQDSCHARLLGDPFLDLPRKILKAVGVEIIEMKRSRREALCCGIADGLARRDPSAILDGSRRQLEEAEKTEAEIVVVYCATCLLMLSIGQMFSPTKTPIYHIIEVLQLATDEEPLRRHAKRAEDITVGLLKKAEFSNERFWITAV
jgi:Fe-S oxidoreductase